MKRLLSLDDAINLGRKEMISLHKEYLNSSLVTLLSLVNLTKKFVKADGMKVWDSDGVEYLDFLGGFGSLNTGHNHPKIISAVSKVKEQPNLLQVSLSSLSGALAYNLAQITPGKLQRSFFCNSGLEAVEGAMKLARLATGRNKIVSAEKSYHGTGNGHKTNKKSHSSDSSHFPLGDLECVRRLLKNKDVAAVIVEPVQGEGGMIVPQEGFLAGVREICDQYDTLLIFDEIQTGLGRTGKMFACEYEHVEPDIMCLAKSLGGGIMPIGAYISVDKVWQKAYGTIEKATLHTSTFGGNSIACAAAIAAIEVIVEEDLVNNALEQGDYLLSKLKDLKSNHKFIKEVRGKGLMIGIEFNQPKGMLNTLSGGRLDKVATKYTGSMFAGELFNKHRIITSYTLNSPNVIRLEPPLSVSKKEIDYLIDALSDILSKNKGFFSLSLSAGKDSIKK